MTGLEKIISQIEYESNDRCRNIIEDANKKAQGIIDNANKEAKKIASDISEETAKKLDNLKQSAISSAELSKSKILLKSKLEIIDDMLNKSLNEIKSLPDKEYFEIVKTLIINNAKEGKGVLNLSQTDKNRLPSDFIDSINNDLKGKSIVMGDTIDIESGFVLVYGDIDINCSFDAIATSKKDELRDALNALLFN